MTFRITFALYASLAVLLLLLGLGPALANSIPALQETFQAWGQGDGFLSELWLGIARAAPFSKGIGRTLVDYSFSLLNVGFGLFIVWRRPRDWTTRLLGFALVGTGSVFNFQAHGVLLTTWDFLSGVHLGIHAISGAAYVHALMIFPNGRLFPRLSAAFLAVVYLLMILSFIFIVIPPALGDSLTAGYTADRFATIVSLDSALFVVFFGLLIPIVGVAWQIYRYNAIYTPQEQQQTKLVVWGISVAFTAGILFILLNVMLNLSLWFDSVGQAVDQLESLVLINFPLLFAIIPISLVAAMLRYGLWDVDVIINRTIVYGVLTVCLAGVYFASVVLLQMGFGVLTNQGGGIAVVLSTLAIIALFQPLRRRLQDFIDQRFYRRKYDAAHALTAFSVRMRDEVDLNALTQEIVTVVEDTVQPAHASLWLRD